MHNYSYDTFGNLKSVTLPNGDIISYALDGQDRRVGIYLNGNLQKQYIWSDQLRMVGELNAAGTLTTQYIYGEKVNVPEYIIKGSTRYKVMTNHLGSVVAVVHSTNGTVTQQIQYDEFGNVTSDTNPGFQPFGFAGGIYDYRTKLVHFNAREYDPETGRWTSKDPILFSGGQANLHGYSFQDPVNFIDVNGQSPVSIGVFITVTTATAIHSYLDSQAHLKCGLRFINPCSPDEQRIQDVNDQITPQNYFNPYNPVFPPPRDNRPINPRSPRREGDNVC